MRLLHTAVTLVIASTALVAFVPAAYAVGDLDQSVSGSTPNSTVVSSSQAVGQIFTAGRTGLLDRITIDVRKEGTPGELNVLLFEVSGGLPSGTALASQVVAANEVTTTMGAVTVNFSSPASITTGVQYAILLESPNSTLTFDMFMMRAVGGQYSWGAENNPLANGSAVFRSSGSWSSSSGDFRFSTFVTSAPATPAVGSSAQPQTSSVNQTGATLAETGSESALPVALMFLAFFIGLTATRQHRRLKTDQSL